MSFPRARGLLGFHAKHTIAEGAREIERALRAGETTDGPETMTSEWYRHLPADHAAADAVRSDGVVLCPHAPNRGTVPSRRTGLDVDEGQEGLVPPPDRQRDIYLSAEYSASRDLPPKVAIVILNWNGAADTLECLRSVSGVAYEDYVVILADNGSTDGSIETLERYGNGDPDLLQGASRPPMFSELTRLQADSAPAGAELARKAMVLIENGRNYGFAQGNDIAIRYCLRVVGAEYILLLNNDTRVDPLFLGELVDAADRLPDAAVVGPVIYYHSKPDSINFSGEDVVLWKGDGVRYTDLPSSPRKVNKIDGACIMFRAEVLRKVGLLYPGFFVYWEETDLCYRVYRAGLGLYCIPTSKIWHKIGASSGGINELNLFRILLLTRNRFLFVRRNGTSGERAMFLMYFFFWDLWRYLRHFLVKRNMTGFFAYIFAVGYGIHAFKGEP